MKKLCFCITMLLPVYVLAQASPGMADNGIYLSDSDFVRHRLTDGFETQKHSGINLNHRDYLVVKLDSAEHKYYYHDIWGYRVNGADWRIFGRDSYKVDYYNACIYLYQVPGTGQGEGLRTTHYFSRTASLPVYAVSKRNLIDVYHDRDDFVSKIKHLGWTRSIFRWDKTHQNYLFVSWLAKDH